MQDGVKLGSADERDEASAWPAVSSTELELLQELELWLGSAGGRPSRRWRSDAACRDLPTDLFFPVGHGPRAQDQARLAKQICADCPVRQECLDYALEGNSRYGVFGGLDEDERHRLRRRLSGAFSIESQLDHGLDDDLEESA